MGSLIGLELAATQPEAVTRLVLSGTTSAMRVHDDLQSAADANERRAHEMILGWSLSGRSGLGGHPTPGLWMHGHLLQTSLNTGDETLAVDLRAGGGVHPFDDHLCAGYLGKRITHRTSPLVRWSRAPARR